MDIERSPIQSGTKEERNADWQSAQYKEYKEYKEYNGGKDAAERDKRQRRHFQSAMYGGCQRGNAERKATKKSNEKRTKKKATGFAVLFFFPCFTREERGKICR